MSLLKHAFSCLLVGSLATVGAAFTAAEAIAQSSDIDPLEGLGTDDDGADLFGDGSNPFDLIHRAILAPSISSEEFQQQQQRAISDEAEAFRLRQQEALRQQQSVDAEGVNEGDAL
ncbi:MAG: hypothetical protein F6J95_019810 [Leptolyngbya sp. SIO1E4]|nr:hypothetical protein [Leptolyngbya sp. SIO1E4]